jgi:hypothetical protein
MKTKVAKKQYLKANVKKERVEKIVSTLQPVDSLIVKQENTISESSIFQLDKTIAIKQEDFIDEKYLYSSETTIVEQGKCMWLSPTP